MEKIENGKVGPALNCKLMDMIGVNRLSIYPDWMHDKNLGTDKATRAHTFLQIVLYTHLQQGWGSFCLTVVWMRGGRGSHTFFYRSSYTHLQQGWGSLSYSGLDEGGRGSELGPQHPLVCYGSTMHLLVHVVMDGDAAENIKTVWAEAKREYDTLGIDRTNRFTNMHATMFKVTRLLFSQSYCTERVCLQLRLSYKGICSLS